MSSIKVLITGGSGLLGQFLNIEFSKHFDILSIYNSEPGNTVLFNRAKVDITNFNEMESVFQTFSPSIVFHTAAVSNPKYADQMPPQNVFNINVNATKNIAELCDLYKAKMFYTSTDLVYAGYRGSMLTESAKLIPISLYAETKLMGEVKIKETFDNYVILRTALLYGLAHPPRINFFHQMVDKLKVGEEVFLFDDQYRTPLSFKEAARIAVKLIDTDIKEEIINYAGATRLSRFELGEQVCEYLNLDKALLIPIKMDDKPDYHPVVDVSLDTNKLRALGIKQLSLYESFEEIFSANKELT